MSKKNAPDHAPASGIAVISQSTGNLPVIYAENNSNLYSTVTIVNDAENGMALEVVGNVALIGDVTINGLDIPVVLATLQSQIAALQSQNAGLLSLVNAITMNITSLTSSLNSRVIVLEGRVSSLESRRP